MVTIEYQNSVLRPTPERAIRIFLNDVPVAVSQGSPYELSELALGYLLSEGLIKDRDSLIKVMSSLDDFSVFVQSSEAAEEGYEPLHRVTSSGCARSALLRQEPSGGSLRKLETTCVYKAEDLLVQMQELCEHSPRRNAGECVHGCGLGDAGQDALIMVREDIGRHNALDKLIGQAWFDRIDVTNKALFITGRISAEMALKAYRSGCAVLVSCKSATDEAALQAEELGITLVSHCREGRIRVLSCPDRIAK